MNERPAWKVERDRQLEQLAEEADALLVDRTVMHVTAVPSDDDYDSPNVLRLTLDDGSEVDIEGTYGNYTGRSRDEYVELISIRQVPGHGPRTAAEAVVARHDSYAQDDEHAAGMKAARERPAARKEARTPLLWVDFNGVDESGATTTLSRFAEPGVSLAIGQTITVGDYEGNLCEARITDIASNGVVTVAGIVSGPQARGYGSGVRPPT